jgi:hypothetical protein
VDRHAFLVLVEERPLLFLVEERFFLVLVEQRLFLIVLDGHLLLRGNGLLGRMEVDEVLCLARVELRCIPGPTELVVGFASLGVHSSFLNRFRVQYVGAAKLR